MKTGILVLLAALLGVTTELPAVGPTGCVVLVCVQCALMAGAVVVAMFCPSHVPVENAWMLLLAAMALACATLALTAAQYGGAALSASAGAASPMASR